MIKIKILDNFWSNEMLFDANYSESIMDQIISSWFDIASSCRNWSCWICSCYVTSWIEKIVDKHWKNLNKPAITTCNSYIKENSEWIIELKAVF